jgi:hypothetical protein
MIVWKRTLRTPSSERFVAVSDGREIATVDLHYLPNLTVVGTVALIDESACTEDAVPDLLASLDEEMLPDVDLEKGNLFYTVVAGRVVGTYEAMPGESDSTPKHH